MNRREFELAALAASNGQSFTPVQLQKLLFLLDRNIGSHLGGSGFDFQPYHYGPFDVNVYSTFASLEHEGLAVIENPNSSRRLYRLTESGQHEGLKILDSLDKSIAAYMGTVGQFVRSLSFAGLVSSIYEAYPEMKANSVFNS